MKKALLILDLDETLMRSELEPFNQAPAFVIREKYLVYPRPGLEDFLKLASEHYEVAFWSSAPKRFVEEAVAGLIPEDLPRAFVWSLEECAFKEGQEEDKGYYVKDLDILPQHGFDLSRCLIVDNTPRKVERQPENHIPIVSFHGDPRDRHLAEMGNLLVEVAEEVDFRIIDIVPASLN